MHPFDFEEYTNKSMQPLLVNISRKYTGKCFYQLMELGIYPGQIPILRLLYEKDGISQREMARNLGIKPPTVNVSIQRMEKSGMVCRRQDEKDQRATKVFLTEKGRESISKAMGRILENESILFGNFSEEELRLMKRFFRQILQNIETMPGSPGDCKYMEKEGLHQ